MTGGHIDLAGLVLEAKWTDLGNRAKSDTELGEFDCAAIDEKEKSPRRCWVLLVGVWPAEYGSNFEDEPDHKKPDAGAVWALILGKPKVSASSRARDGEFVRIGLATRSVEDIYDLWFGDIVETSIYYSTCPSLQIRICSSDTRHCLTCGQ